MIKRIYKSYSLVNYAEKNPQKKLYEERFYDEKEISIQRRRAKWVVEKLVEKWGGISAIKEPHNLDLYDEYYDGYGCYDYARYIQDR